MFQIQHSLNLKTRVVNIRRSSERSGLNLFSIQNKNKTSHQPLCQERPERGPGWASTAACLPRRSRTGEDEVALSKQLVLNPYGSRYRFAVVELSGDCGRSRRSLA
jgi:hypothetical protein